MKGGGRTWCRWRGLVQPPRLITSIPIVEESDWSSSSSSSSFTYDSCSFLSIIWNYMMMMMMMISIIYQKLKTTLQSTLLRRLSHKQTHHLHLLLWMKQHLVIYDISLSCATVITKLLGFWKLKIVFIVELHGSILGSRLERLSDGP